MAAGEQRRPATPGRPSPYLGLRSSKQPTGLSPTASGATAVAPKCFLGLVAEGTAKPHTPSCGEPPVRLPSPLLLHDPLWPSAAGGSTASPPLGRPSPSALPAWPGGAGPATTGTAPRGSLSPSGPIADGVAGSPAHGEPHAWLPLSSLGSVDQRGSPVRNRAGVACGGSLLPVSGQARPTIPQPAPFLSFPPGLTANKDRRPQGGGNCSTPATARPPTSLFPSPPSH